MADADDRAFVLNLIEFYRGLPALWDVKSAEYSNKILREQQNQQLLEKYQERYPSACKKDVAKKNNNLRSNYKRELKRMKESERSGAGVDGDIECSLYYFDAMSFIKDVETPSSSRTTFQTDNEPQQKRKRNDTSATDELVRLATDYVRKPHDACRSAANAWAERLLEMDREQRILAEKLMSDVVFNGQLGLLDYTTTLSNLRTPARTSTPAIRSNSVTFVSESSASSLHNNNEEYTSYPASTGYRMQNIRPQTFVLPPTPSPQTFVLPPTRSPQTFVLPPMSSPKLLSQTPPANAVIPIAVSGNAQNEVYHYVQHPANGDEGDLSAYFSSYKNNNS